MDATRQAASHTHRFGRSIAIGLLGARLAGGIATANETDRIIVYVPPIPADGCAVMNPLAPAP